MDDGCISATMLIAGCQIKIFVQACADVTGGVPRAHRALSLVPSLLHEGIKEDIWRSALSQ